MSHCRYMVADGDRRNHDCSLARGGLPQARSVALPFFGVEPAILREDGTECEVNEGGYLVMRNPGLA